MARLQSDALFQGLARPTMVLGVSYMYFVMNGIISLICFINFQTFKILLIVAPAIHLVGYLICMKEPRALDMLVLKISKGMRCINRNFHGSTNSYDPY